MNSTMQAYSNTISNSCTDVQWRSEMMRVFPNTYVSCLARHGLWERLAIKSTHDDVEDKMMDAAIRQRMKNNPGFVQSQVFGKSLGSKMVQGRMSDGPVYDADADTFLYLNHWTCALAVYLADACCLARSDVKVEKGHGSDSVARHSIHVWVRSRALAAYNDVMRSGLQLHLVSVLKDMVSERVAAVCEEGSRGAQIAAAGVIHDHHKFSLSVYAQDFVPPAAPASKLEAAPVAPPKPKGLIKVTLR